MTRCGAPPRVPYPGVRVSAGVLEASLLHVYDLGVHRGASVYGVLSWYARLALLSFPR